MFGIPVLKDLSHGVAYIIVFLVTLLGTYGCTKLLTTTGEEALAEVIVDVSKQMTGHILKSREEMRELRRVAEQAHQQIHQMKPIIEKIHGFVHLVEQEIPMEIRDRIKNDPHPAHH